LENEDARKTWAQAHFRILPRANATAREEDERQGVGKLLPRIGVGRVPRTNLLLIDKDIIMRPKEIGAYLQLVHIVLRAYQLEAVLVQWCYSLHKGMHFYIQVNRLIEGELAWLLQLLLGDDAVRADFGRARIEAGVAHWNRLFERSNVKLRIIYQNPRLQQRTPIKKNAR
jgi:hypothetical protein